MSGSLFGKAPLVDRYRPATWQEVVGQEKTVSKLQQLAQRRAGWPRCTGCLAALERARPLSPGSWLRKWQTSFRLTKLTPAR